MHDSKYMRKQYPLPNFFYIIYILTQRQNCYLGDVGRKLGDPREKHPLSFTPL